MEDTLGDISGNKLHQGIEVLQREGFLPELWHRMRLDPEYRKRLIAASHELDQEPPERWCQLEYENDFCHPSGIVKHLKEHSWYSGPNSHLLRDDILMALMMPEYDKKIVHVYPTRLYFLDLYQDMTEGRVLREFSRRGLMSASSTDALHYAATHEPLREDRSVGCLSAQYKAKGEPPQILSLSRNEHGDPSLGLRQKPRTFVKGDIFLVKVRPA